MQLTTIIVCFAKNASTLFLYKYNVYKLILDESFKFKHKLSLSLGWKTTASPNCTFFRNSTNFNQNVRKRQNFQNE